MEIRAAEISAILKKQIAQFDTAADVAEVPDGLVLRHPGDVVEHEGSTETARIDAEAGQGYDGCSQPDLPAHGAGGVMNGVLFGHGRRLLQRATGPSAESVQ